MNIVLSNITGVKFYVLDKESIQKMASIEVTSANLFQNDKPYPEGIYDARLGTTDMTWNCNTCENVKNLCPGHYGFYKLKTNIISPLFVNYVYTILKNVCYECGAYLRGKQECEKCNKRQPIYSRSNKNPFLFYMATSDNPLQKQRLHPFSIYNIFSRIIPEDVVLLGFPKKFHPVSFVQDVIVVPPTSIRPDAKPILSSKHNSNDITILLANVIKLNKQLQIPDNLSDLSSDISDAILQLNIAVYELIRGPYMQTSAAISKSSKKVYAGALMNKIQSKGGIIRHNIMGRRVKQAGRAIITGNTDLPIDTIGLPLYIARAIKKKVHVREYNYKQCLVWYLNGSKTYPGASHICKQGDSYLTNVDIVNKVYTLKYGDVLYRDLIDGDIIVFNRQPTLEPTSMTAVTIKVISDNTIQMNVNACGRFNADFDGDEMNVFFPSTTAAECEAMVLFSGELRYISDKDSSPKCCEVLDSIIGMSYLTSHKTRMTRYHYLNIFNGVKFAPDIAIKKHDDVYNGYDVVSEYMKHNSLFINFTRRATCADQLFTQFFDIPKEDSTVVIRYGIMESGILDKAAIGENEKYNIFHLIFNQYGYKSAINASFDLQQLALQHVKHNKGFSISYRDFYVNRECRDKIKQITQATIDNSRIISQNLYKKLIIPPFGQTLEQYYEATQVNTLDNSELLLRTLLAYISKDNNLLFSIKSGAKGKMFNIKNILAQVGQTLVDARRLSKNFSFERTMPYNCRYNEEPEARGFISGSYNDGLSPLEFYTHCGDSRFAIILKALSTAEAGSRQRKDMKSFESLLVNNSGYVTSTSQIVQFLYGGNGFIQTYNEVDYIHLLDPSLTLSTFEQMFHTKHENKEATQHLDAEYKHLLHLRTKYLPHYLTSHKVVLPINMDILFKSFITKERNKLNILDALKSIQLFLYNIVYIYLNNDQRVKQIKVLPHLRYAIKEVKLYLWSYLNIATLQKYNIDNSLLALCFDKIKYNLVRSLAPAGMPIGSIATMCINEPLTQKVLDSHHYSGSGADASKRSFMTKFNEIFTCKDTTLTGTATSVIYFTDAVQNDKYTMTLIANNMEMVNMNTLILSYEILYKPYDITDSVAKAFIETTSMKPMYTLLNICFKLYINKYDLVIRNTSIELIYLQLSKRFPNYYIYYTSRLDNPMYVMMYPSTLSLDNKRTTLTTLKNILDNNILKTVIRGIPNIYSASVKDEIMKYIDTDGSVQQKKIYYIKTIGTNLAEIFTYDTVDVLRSYSDSLIEMFNLFGIISSNKTIYRELSTNLGGLDTKHYKLYADLMTCTGYCTSVDRYGAKHRKESILSQITESSPINLLTVAAVNNQYDTIDRLSNAILLGQVPRVGSNYNKLEFDIQAAYANVEENILDEI